MTTTAEQIGKLIEKCEILNFSTVFNSLDELFNSTEYNDLWEGFQGKTRQINTLKKFEFLTAFKVDTDPKLNYNRKYDLYIHYVTPLGMKVLSKIEIYSILCGQSLRECLIFKDSALLTNTYYKNHIEAIKYIKNSDITVM